MHDPEATPYAMPGPRRSRLTVQWTDCLQMALDRMDRAGCDELLVLDGCQPMGRIGRGAIARLKEAGNWLGAVCVSDAMRR